MDRTAKTLTIALAVSLALNLFFVGFALGRRSGWFHGRPRPHMRERMELMSHGRRGPHPGMELGPAGFLRRAGLSDAGPEVERVIEARREELRERRASVRRARSAVAEALSAEPFDAERFAASLTALQAESARVQTEMHATFVGVAKTLSPEQRRRVAKAPWFLHEPPGPPDAPP